jgi:error-prone DNA polymerase
VLFRSVDFEHERREEVIQYIYGKYGRDRTALAAALSTYRIRGAVRDVGKALDLDALVIDAIAKSHQWFDGRETLDARFTEHGLDPESPVTRQWTELAMTLQGFPRHLSQHTGGFVIARHKLSRLVPIEPAAMDNRRVIQWDKDDLESLGLLKVDVLALGMLTAMRRTFALLQGCTGQPWSMDRIPWDDPATYAMTHRADTVGVFQIESRAQQSMLPRLKPEQFYDLVIEVAIVRPGPIQGGMVHPYLRRKQGKEPVSCPPALEPALKRTLGVPIFQEQVMQVCKIGRASCRERVS